ncbi:MAG: hypothetical protein N2203_05535 [Bacteroidia bacterium]|nr:hypothetical protein [Bacteroidia bacterium]
MSDYNDNDELKQIKREIILLKRKIEHLKFKNSFLFKFLNTVNIAIFILYFQFISSYIFDFNLSDVLNSNIQFNVYKYQSESIKIYTIKFKYYDYFFRVKINKTLDKSVVYSDAVITKDPFFQIPQKFKLKNYSSQWFFVNESLGILTICAIIVFVQGIAYLYRQNEYYYPLFSISLLSVLSFIGIVFFSLYIHNFI